MQRLVIDRDKSLDVGTFGDARFLSDPRGDGENRELLGSWHSLELPWRGNEPDRSCIPPGVYLAKAAYSPKFKRVVYHLQDVPGRTSVEMHAANWAGDIEKGYKSDLEGCSEIGMGVGVLTPQGHQPQPAILHSGDALDQLLQLAGAVDDDGSLTGVGDIEIEYRWSPGNEPGDWPAALPTA